MAQLRCSRCDRLQNPDEFGGFSRLLLNMPLPEQAQSLFGGPGPWASIDGSDVCSECQTAAERESVALRIVAAVEAEVDRATAVEAEPPPPESPVIAYAMQLRERLMAGDRSSASDDQADVSSKAGSERRVAVTAAFLTGQPLRIPISEYESLRRNLSQALAKLEGQGWSVDVGQWRHGGTYHSGGGFTSMLPLVLARREGADTLARTASILDYRPQAERDWLARHAAGWTLTPTSMRIDVYDLGMAIMNGVFVVRTPPNIGIQASVRTLKQLVWLKPDAQESICSPITETFRELAKETTQQFATAIAVAPGVLQRPWLAPFLDAVSKNDPPDHPRRNDWGRLLWLHPVHVLEVDDASALASTAASVAPPFHRSIDIPDGRFVAGIGWSAVVTERAPSSAEVPLQLVELHWAYIALYMEIDRGLLALLDSDQWELSRSLTELERDANQVFADYMRVVKARARVDSALASLGGDEQAMWDVIADVTKFDALINGVDRKVDALQHIADRRVQQAAAVQARRTSAILSFLTALTIVTVTVALIGNFFGGLSDPIGHIELRIMIVGVAFLASIGLYREAFRQRSPRHRKRS